MIKKNKNHKPGLVIWITGLSGSGKTTLAKALLNYLPSAILLDGDDLRYVLNAENTAFDIEGRKRLAVIYARLAKMLALQGYNIVVATISLFHEVHKWNRENISSYVEVFIDIPEDIRRERDPKGLYKADEKAEISQMAGKGTKAEFPKNPDLILDEHSSVENSVLRILDFIKSKYSQSS